MSSTFGNVLHLSIFGQSHSPAIGCSLDGIPAGNIGVVTLAPHGKLISFLGLLCRVGIEILVILTHHPYPR